MATRTTPVQDGNDDDENFSVNGDSLVDDIRTAVQNNYEFVGHNQKEEQKEEEAQDDSKKSSSLSLRSTMTTDIDTDTVVAASPAARNDKRNNFGGKNNNTKRDGGDELPRNSVVTLTEEEILNYTRTTTHTKEASAQAYTTASFGSTLTRTSSDDDVDATATTSPAFSDSHEYNNTSTKSSNKSHERTASSSLLNYIHSTQSSHRSNNNNNNEGHQQQQQHQLASSEMTTMGPGAFHVGGTPTTTSSNNHSNNNNTSVRHDSSIDLDPHHFALPSRSSSSTGLVLLSAYRVDEIDEQQQEQQRRRHNRDQQRGQSATDQNVATVSVMEATVVVPAATAFSPTTNDVDFNSQSRPSRGDAPNDDGKEEEEEDVEFGESSSSSRRKESNDKYNCVHRRLSKFWKIFILVFVAVGLTAVFMILLDRIIQRPKSNSENQQQDQDNMEDGTTTSTSPPTLLSSSLPPSKPPSTNLQPNDDEPSLPQDGDLVFGFFDNNIPDDSPIWIPGTPQYRAFEYVMEQRQEGGGDTGAIVIDERNTEILFALVTFYFATNGDEWINNDRWLDMRDNSDNQDGSTNGNGQFKSSPFCLWYGISCTSTNPKMTSSSVTPLPLSFDHPAFVEQQQQQQEEEEERTIYSLDLSSNNLVGWIPSELGMKIPDLQHLDLSWNDINSTLPSTLGLLELITYFDLSNNPNLIGTLPSELGTAWEDTIQDIHIENTALIGTVPSQICDVIESDDVGFGVTFVADCRPDEDTLLTKISCDCCTTCCGAAAPVGSGSFVCTPGQ